MHVYRSRLEGHIFSHIPHTQSGLHALKDGDAIPATRIRIVCFAQHL